jgi:signal transduction histidine kinase
MKIQRMLLISFFVLLSLVAVSLTAVAFFSSKAMLKAEIGRNLTSDAAMLMEKIDMLIFERLQNVHSWSHLDIMQEARIGDVDKRLSQFLGNLELGYKGVYRDLFYVDAQQRVVSASTPALIGQNYHPEANWVHALVPNGEVFIEQLQLTSPYTNVNLVIRAPVHDRYAEGDIGQLYGFFDMQHIFQLLDKASGSDSGNRYIVLLDAEGRTIAASSDLRKPEFLLKSTFSGWKPDKGSALFVHDGKAISASEVLVGYAHSSGYLGYADMGWSLLVFQSTAKAFLPIYTLLKLFIGIITLTMLLAFWVSQWISGRIAKPLLDLTQWVRSVRHFEKPTPPKLAGTLEIRELETAFAEMLQELEHSREQVIQASKLAVVGEMAAIMAHEVRTPLGILSTSAQMLQTEPSLSLEGMEMTQFILDESARLRRLVTTLLECARPRQPQMLPHNLHDLISHSVQLLTMQAHKKQLPIEQQLHMQNPVIICDDELITQVLLNLLINAIQIVPNDGRIYVRTSTLGHQACIEIADNGSGIAIEDYPRLFEPFFTKRDGGIGLGLTVTKQIMLAHHGSIFAKQSEWGGACFTLYLPITQD